MVGNSRSESLSLKKQSARSRHGGFWLDPAGVWRMKTVQSLALLNGAVQAASALRQWLLAVALVLAGLAVAFAEPLLPRPDHIVIVIEENHSFDEILGPPINVAPYIKQLAKQGASFSDSHGLVHPNHPNYLHLFSGDNQGVTTDERPGRLPFDTPNLAAELFDRNLGFTGYSEDLPEVGSDTNLTNSDRGYVRKHNPWVNWQAAEFPSLEITYLHK